MTPKLRLLYLHELEAMLRCAPVGLQEGFEEFLKLTAQKRQRLENLLKNIESSGDLDWELNDDLAVKYYHTTNEPEA